MSSWLLLGLEDRGSSLDMTVAMCTFRVLVMTKEMLPSPRPEAWRLTVREGMSQLTLQEAAISGRDGSLLGNGHFIFCVCASKGPCQHTLSHTTLSATVFDRLHCKQAACNSLFVPVYILDCLLVTLLFWSLGEYLIHNHVFLEIILFPGSYVKAN